MRKAHGNSLGGAILDMIEREGGTPGTRLKTYNRKGWNAQLRQLGGTARGRRLLAEHGPKVTDKTMRGWLSGKTTPRPGNRQAIQDAYQKAAQPFPQSLKNRQFAIKGEIGIGGERTRQRGGVGGESPLRIAAVPHGWNRIEAAYISGDLDEETAEEYFIEDIIEEDLGMTTDEWNFPGSSYTIDYA